MNICLVLMPALLLISACSKTGSVELDGLIEKSKSTAIDRAQIEKKVIKSASESPSKVIYLVWMGSQKVGFSSFGYVSCDKATQSKLTNCSYYED